MNQRDPNNTVVDVELGFKFTNESERVEVSIADTNLKCIRQSK